MRVPISEERAEEIPQKIRVFDRSVITLEPRLAARELAEVELEMVRQVEGDVARKQHGVAGGLADLLPAQFRRPTLGRLLQDSDVTPRRDRCRRSAEIADPEAMVGRDLRLHRRSNVAHCYDLAHTRTPGVTNSHR